MKKTLIILILVMVILGLIILIACTHVKNKEITKSCNFKSSDGNSYLILIRKFDTPYSPQYKKSLSEVDLSTIKGFIDAYYSASSYGWVTYLTLLDEGAKKEAMEVDTESQGDYSKGFNDNLGKAPAQDMPVIYTHWIELNLNQKTYGVVVGNYSITVGEKDAEKYEGIAVPIIPVVKQDNKWLMTNDLFSNRLVTEITLKDYNSLLSDCS